MGVGKNENIRGDLNYYVITGIFISVLFFTVVNSFEPQIDAQLDFFELVFILGYTATAVFSFIVAKRYWGSEIFGKAYVALGIAYAATAIGATLFDVYQIQGIANPYPYYPDIFFALFYPFAIYHLRRNTNYFKRKLDKKQKTILIIIPATITLAYAFALLVPITILSSVPDLLSSQEKPPKLVPNVNSINGPSNSLQSTTIGNTTYYLVPVKYSGSTIYPQIYDKNVLFKLVPIVITNMKFGQMQQHDQTFYNGFYMGVFYVAATTFTFAWAIIGFQVFRGTVLGIPWGLLLVGIGLNSIGDMSYYYTSIYSYDRTNPIIGVWVGGCMIVCYALYRHRKQI